MLFATRINVRVILIGFLSPNLNSLLLTHILKFIDGVFFVQTKSLLHRNYILVVNMYNVFALCKTRVKGLCQYATFDDKFIFSHQANKRVIID